MEKLDIDALLQDISPDAPCGANVEYEADYLELETLARGKPAVQFRPGEAVQEAEEPNWDDIEKRCIDLLRRSKHLRVILYLTVALMRRRGAGGLRDGLALLRGILERYWDTCYPQLDAEDNNDPTERLNVLVALSLPPEDQTFDFRNRFHQVPLCESRRVGRFGLRQILMARGELTPLPGQEAPAAATIDSAFEDADIEGLQEIFLALEGAAEHLKAIRALLVERLVADKAVSFEEFFKALDRARSEVGRQLERRGHATGVPVAATESSATDAVGTGGPSLSGAVNTTQDVIAALDKICEYYGRQEPSSPIPLILKRARRLVGKSFAEIIQDLSPEAMTQIKVISGAADEGA